MQCHVECVNSMSAHCGKCIIITRIKFGSLLVCLHSCQIPSPPPHTIYFTRVRTCNTHMAQSLFCYGPNLQIHMYIMHVYMYTYADAQYYTRVKRNTQARGIWRILRVLAIYCALHVVDRKILSRSAQARTSVHERAGTAIQNKRRWHFDGALSL